MYEKVVGVGQGVILFSADFESAKEKVGLRSSVQSENQTLIIATTMQYTHYCTN